VGAELPREEAQAEQDELIRMAKLVLRLPDGTTRDIRLDRDRMTIGRRADNDLCLPYPAVSADHAEIVTVATDSFLHDRGSTNGTLVNGNRITRHFLRDHDTIDIGRLQAVYLTNEAETLPPIPVEPVNAEARRAAEPAPAAAKAGAGEQRVAAYVDSANADDAERARTDAVDRATAEEVDRDLRHVRAASAVRKSRRSAPADELLEDLMDANTGASVAVDMPPTVSVVPARRRPSAMSNAASGNEAPADVVVEVLSGPHAGRITPMTKSEFVLGKAGVTVAAIRRQGGGYRLVVLNREARPSLNGLPLDADSAALAFGDTIDVAGVKLRFSRARPT
jgi:pSer/pThr/pTyr-binding forkhead associated (FHA) protein